MFLNKIIWVLAVFLRLMTCIQAHPKEEVVEMGEGDCFVVFFLFCLNYNPCPALGEILANCVLTYHSIYEEKHHRITDKHIGLSSL